MDFIQNLGSDLVVGTISAAATLVGGYIVIRERLLKNEIKTENIYDYIDSRNELIEAKIKDMQNDLNELKGINKEISSSLAQNTMAIQELRIVLNMLKEQLKQGK